MGEIIIEMVNINCDQCSIQFSVTKAFDKKRREDGAGFNCPNGHVLEYKKTDLDYANDKIAKLQKDFKYSKGNRDMWKGWYEMEKRTTTALKGHLTRLRNKLNR